MTADLELFTEYSLTSAGVLTVNSDSMVTFTNMAGGGSSSMVRKTPTAVNDFTLTFDFQVTATNSGTGAPNLVNVSDTGSGGNGVIGSNSVGARWIPSNKHIDLVLMNAGSPNIFDTGIVTTLGTRYYLTLKRIGTAVTLTVYSDAARTNVLGSASTTQGTTYRFVTVLYSYNNSTYTMSGDLDNVSVTYNTPTIPPVIITNPSEQLTQYQTINPNGHITVNNDTKISFSGLLGNETAYDRLFEPNIIGDFTLYFDFLISSTNSGAGSLDLVQLSDTNANNNGSVGANGAGLIISGKLELVALQITANSNNQTDLILQASLNKRYFVTISRTGSSITVQIFTDSARTNLISSATITQATNYSYVNVPYSYANSALSMSGDVSNVNITFNNHLQVTPITNIFTGTSLITSNVVADSSGNIFFGDVNGRLFKVQPDGTSSNTLIGGGQITVVVTDGSNVYACTGNPGVPGTYRITKYDNSLNNIWNVSPAANRAFLAMVLTSNSLYVGSDLVGNGGDFQYRLNLSNGAVINTFDTTNGGGCFRGFALIGNNLFFPTVAGDSSPGAYSKSIVKFLNDGTFLAVRTETGAHETIPAVSGDNAFLYYGGGQDNKITKIKTVDLSFLWSLTTGGNTFSDPTIDTDGTVIYCGSNDGKIYAINDSNGSQKWVYTAQGNVNAAPVIKSNLLYVFDGAGYIFVLNKSDGSLSSYLSANANNATGITNTTVTDSINNRLYVASGTNVYYISSFQTITISCPIGWCYLGMDSASKTLLDLDNLFTTDTIQGRFNNLTQKNESHSTGFAFNQNVTVQQKEGYYYYFSSAQNVTLTPGTNPSITLKQGWNLVANYGTAARTLSALKSSIGASATQAQYYDRTLKIWISADNQSVPAMEAFFVNVNADTVWSG